MTRGHERLNVAFVLYDNFTMLDIVGPFNLFTAVPGVRPVWVAETIGPVVDHTRSGALVAGTSLDDMTDPDVVVVPGGLGTHEHFDGAVVEWIRDVHPGTMWTTSVCTGALLLGAAGLLRGLTATTHWGARDALAAQGADVIPERVVIHPEQRIATGAGVSAGLDLSLELIARLFDAERAMAAQLAIEYDPQPRFSSGSLEGADPEVVDLAVDGLMRAAAETE